MDLLEAARQRLLLWDIRPADIARLEQAGQVTRTLDLHADIGGYVVQKMAFHGMRVTPADTLFDIADLSHLWVLADVYESDLPSLALGTEGSISVPYLPGQDLEAAGHLHRADGRGEDAHHQGAHRGGQPGGALKPEMFADVVLHVDLGAAWSCPTAP